MAAKKKKVDLVKQREKRSKIAAVVCLILLIAVGAYEIPSMLAVMNKKPPPGTTYDPGPSIRPGGLPNVAAGSGSASSSTNSSGQLVNSDAPPPTEAGQLVSFSVFETKNPFTPQVSSAQAPPDTGPAPTTAEKQGADTTATTTTPAPTPAAPTSTAPSSVVPPTSMTQVTTTPTSTTTTTTPVQPTVAISVNGVVSHVGTDGTFPTRAPVFRLVSWTKSSAQIGIVGGSYASGAGTLTLQVGSPVTLENQTDGKQYRIELLSTS
jgi:hypothetical protein